MLLTGTISHTSIQYMDFVEIFNASLYLSTICFIFLILVGDELPLCIVVMVVTLPVFWSQVEYKRSVLLIEKHYNNWHVVRFN